MIVTVGLNSYITEVELQSYASDRGITLTGDITILIAKAMDYLETREFKGVKLVETQPLEFPRDIYEVVPQGIKTAQCIASILIAQGNELQGVKTQAVKSEQVGHINVTYQDNTDQANQYVALNDVLKPYLFGSQYSAKVVRV